MNAAPSLPEIQLQVLDALRDRPDGATAQRAVRFLKEAPGPSSHQRLQVYRNNLREGLTAALTAVFPVVAQLVGEAYFRQVARLYMTRHPLRTGHLHSFGQQMPDLLRTLPAASDCPYLADVAALEWAWHEVYHEADTQPLEAELLQEVPADQQMNLGLQLSAAARVVSSPYPILRIWQAHQGQADPLFRISLDEGGIHLLVLRRNLEIEFVLLDESEASWLRELQAGATLAQATEVALDARLSFDLLGTMRRHLSLGTFSALSFATLPTVGEQT
jgi:hypothetical protein